MIIYQETRDNTFMYSNKFNKCRGYSPIRTVCLWTDYYAIVEVREEWVFLKNNWIVMAWLPSPITVAKMLDVKGLF